MEKYSLLLTVSLLFTNFYPIRTQVCDPNNNYGIEIGLNKCLSNQVKVNNTCLSCKVQNCILCSVFNQNECDICKKGYILDKLSTSECLPLGNNAFFCHSTSCLCDLPLVNDNGECKKCLVSNCRLCSAGNAKQCDKCYYNYQLDSNNGFSCVQSREQISITITKGIIIFLSCLILISSIVAIVQIVQKYLKKKNNLDSNQNDHMDKIPSSARSMGKSIES